MSDVSTLSARARDRVGKGSARAARREGLVPAVVYGNKQDPIAVTLVARELVKMTSVPGFFSSLLDLEVDGKKHRVLPRDVQLHPVTDVPEHVDFLRVSASTELNVEVQVEFTGEEECEGLKRGGVLNVVRYMIEVSCRADAIPDTIQVPLDGLDIGDSVHISAVNLPDGVTPTIDDRDFTIATIAAPTVVADEAAEETAAAEEALAAERGEEEGAGEEGGEEG